MLAKSRTLFILEGERTEGRYFASLEKNFVGKELAITCAFGADIYQLHKSLSNDDDLDIVNLLKERATYKGELDGFNRDSFEGVYLFFDYDGHATGATPDKIKRLLQYFNNETEHGKLFISYPMIEALRHYRDMEHFKCLTVSGQVEDYKNLVSHDCRPQLNNINQYTREVWCELIFAHLCRMNSLVHNQFSFPQQPEDQDIIFAKQLKLLTSKQEIAVLSAIPPFVLDYFGCIEMRNMLNA